MAGSRNTSMASGTWRKSPVELVDLFASVLPDDPAVERRQMFGYPCAFVNGNMFTGLHQEALIVRLAEDDRNRLIEKIGATRFEPMPGRPMQEYVALPETLLNNREELIGIIRSARNFAASLPPKAKRQRKRKTARSK